jgi:hypothetical protein
MRGIFAGAAAGVIDVTPMVLQKLPLAADLSAFIMWIVVGFFIPIANFKAPGLIKGIIVAFLVLAPTAIIIGFKEPMSLIPIGLMTMLLGALLGWSIEKMSNKKEGAAPGKN